MGLLFSWVGSVDFSKCATPGWAPDTQTIVLLSNAVSSQRAKLIGFSPAEAVNQNFKLAPGCNAGSVIDI